MRKPKALWTEQVGGELIQRYFAEDEADEAEWVGREMHRLHESEGVAVVGHGHLLPDQRPEPGAGGAPGPPQDPVQGHRRHPVLRRREVKDVLAYLRAVVNPSDEVSLRRIVNVPKRGVGDTQRRPAGGVGGGVGQAAGRRPGQGRGGGREREGAGRHPRPGRLLQDLRDAEMGPAATLERVLAVTGYAAELRVGALHRGRREAGEPGRAGRVRPPVRGGGRHRGRPSGIRLPRDGQPGGRLRRDRPRRVVRSCS